MIHVSFEIAQNSGAGLLGYFLASVLASRGGARTGLT